MAADGPALSVANPRARLPAPALPRTVLSKLRQAERAYRRAGSLDAAARALDVRPVLVRRRLQFARAVRSLPRVRAVGCRGR